MTRAGVVIVALVLVEGDVGHRAHRLGRRFDVGFEVSRGESLDAAHRIRRVRGIQQDYEANIT